MPLGENGSRRRPFLREILHQSDTREVDTTMLESTMEVACGPSRACSAIERQYKEKALSLLFALVGHGDERGSMWVIGWHKTKVDRRVRK